MPFSYQCEINNSLDKDIDCNIKLSLLDSQENLLEVLYNNTHHLPGGGTYEFSGDLPMPDIDVPGKCWLQLEVWSCSHLDFDVNFNVCSLLKYC